MGRCFTLMPKVSTDYPVRLWSCSWSILGKRSFDFSGNLQATLLHCYTTVWNQTTAILQDLTFTYMSRGKLSQNTEFYRPAGSIIFSCKLMRKLNWNLLYSSLLSFEVVEAPVRMMTKIACQWWVKQRSVMFKLILKLFSVMRCADGGLLKITPHAVDLGWQFRLRLNVTTTKTWKIWLSSTRGKIKKLKSFPSNLLNLSFLAWQTLTNLFAAVLSLAIRIITRPSSWIVKTTRALVRKSTFITLPRWSQISRNLLAMTQLSLSLTWEDLLVFCLACPSLGSLWFWNGF